MRRAGGTLSGAAGAAVISLAGALVGCGGTAPPPELSSPFEEPAIATYPGGFADGAGALDGVVVIREGCLLIEESAGGVWLPVFPEPSAAAIPGGVQFDGVAFTTGETISLLGAAFPAGFGLPGATVPRACAGQDAWVVSGPAAD